MNQMETYLDVRIESGLTIPPPRHLYPFHRLEIGQSFAVPIDAKAGSEATADARGRLAVAAHQFGKRNPEYRFTVRKLTGEFRVWRVPV